MNHQMEIGEGLERIGLGQSAGLVDQLDLFIQSLIKWNRVYNLIGSGEEKRIISRHLLDSLTIQPHIRGSRVVDVGSGGGFPGVPLAIYMPDTHFTLIDSNGKKTRFLEQLRIILQLDNCEIVQSRVESVESSFDQVVCRAFASLAEITRKTAHLLMTGCEILALKGRLDSDETDVCLAPFRIKEILSLNQPLTDAERHLVIMEKA